MQDEDKDGTGGDEWVTIVKKQPFSGKSQKKLKVNNLQAATFDSSLVNASQTTLDQTKAKWKKEQLKLKKKLILTDDFNTNDIRYIGGVDISFNPNNRNGNENDAVASLVVLSYPDLKLVYEAYHRVSMNAPYIAGYLGFREVPHVIRLLSELKRKKPEIVPQIIVADGNGILHMRGFGFACHLGVLSNIPTIGVAKKLLCVDGITHSKVEKWVQSYLKSSSDTHEMIGASGKVHGAIFKPDATQDPIYISPGHRISLQTSIDIVKHCCLERIPEPIRQADLRSRQAIKQINNSSR